MNIYFTQKFKEFCFQCFSKLKGNFENHLQFYKITMDPSKISGSFKSCTSYKKFHNPYKDFLEASKAVYEFEKVLDILKSFKYLL